MPVIGSSRYGPLDRGLGLGLGLGANPGPHLDLDLDLGFELVSHHAAGRGRGSLLGALRASACVPPDLAAAVGRRSPGGASAAPAVQAD